MSHTNEFRGEYEFSEKNKPARLDDDFGLCRFDIVLKRCLTLVLVNTAYYSVAECAIHIVGGLDEDVIIFVARDTIDHSGRGKIGETAEASSYRRATNAISTACVKIGRAAWRERGYGRG